MLLGFLKCARICDTATNFRRFVVDTEVDSGLRLPINWVTSDLDLRCDPAEDQQEIDIMLGL